MLNVALAQMNVDVILVLGEIYFNVQMQPLQRPFESTGGSVPGSLSLYKRPPRSAELMDAVMLQCPPSLSVSQGSDRSAGNNYN